MPTCPAAAPSHPTANTGRGAQQKTEGPRGAAPRPGAPRAARSPPELHGRLQADSQPGTTAHLPVRFPPRSRSGPASRREQPSPPLSRGASCPPGRSAGWRRREARGRPRRRQLSPQARLPRPAPAAPPGTCCRRRPAAPGGAEGRYGRCGHRPRADRGEQVRSARPRNRPRRLPLPSLGWAGGAGLRRARPPARPPPPPSGATGRDQPPLSPHTTRPQLPASAPLGFLRSFPPLPERGRGEVGRGVSRSGVTPGGGCSLTPWQPDGGRACAFCPRGTCPHTAGLPGRRPWRCHSVPGPCPALPGVRAVPPGCVRSCSTRLTSPASAA